MSKHVLLSSQSTYLNISSSIAYQRIADTIIVLCFGFKNHLNFNSNPKIINWHLAKLFNFLTDEQLIPEPPISVWFSEKLDTRIGFFGHVILNISWEPPLSMCKNNYYNTVESVYSGHCVRQSPPDLLQPVSSSSKWQSSIPHTPL